MLGDVYVFAFLFLLLFGHREAHRTLQVIYFLYLFDRSPAFQTILSVLKDKFSLRYSLQFKYIFNITVTNILCPNRARRVYVCGLLFYSTGMMMMALTKHPVGVIIFSWTAGVMYSTLFTMPYLLVAHYHASSTVSNIHGVSSLLRV